MPFLPYAILPPAEAERLLDAAFGPGRNARAAQRVRAGLRPLADLSLALSIDGMIAGSLQCYAVALHHDAATLATTGQAASPLTLVGPIAVHPDHQNRGYGRAMLTEALARIDAAGGGPQVLVGDAPYYAPFGFSAHATAGWRLPGAWDPARLLARGWPDAAGVRSGLVGPPV
jgi:predicted N-acetyltransferase YhbS